MAQITVSFTFHCGIKRKLFQNVRLCGSWDANGLFSNQWTQVPMSVAQDGTGCDAFSASVAMDGSQVGTTFQWGVFADLVWSRLPALPTIRLSRLGVSSRE
jgi:1,4-alpha-glucan branching enzyme